MREAEIAALPLSSPPKRPDGEDEGEEGEDERSLPAAAAGGASPAIRPPSPGYSGMGEVEASCREGAGGGLLEGSGVDEELEFPPGFEKVSEIMEVNGGSGNWVLEVEATEAVQRRESGVSVDIRNSSELSPLGREEVKDGCRAAEVGKERVVASVDIGNCSEREYVGGCMSVGNGDCEELEVPPGFEKVGEAMEVNGCSGDRVLEVVVAEAVHIGDSGVSVDIRSSSELSSLGREKVEDGYGEVAEVGKECVPPATENGDCSEASISERKEIKEESQLHVDEDALGDNNAASVGIRNGSEVSVPGKKDNGEECWGVLRVEEENGLAESEAPNMVVEEEHDDFPGLSPLRISGGDGLGNSSGIDIGLEVGHIVEMFDNGRVCDEDAFLGTSELAAGCSSVEINGDSDKQTGEFCAPSHLSEECLSVSQGSNANWLAEKCENLLQLEPEKLNSGECNDNMNCSNECSREKNEVAVEYQGAKIEQAEADISGPLEVISTHLKEVVEGDRCQTSLLENEVYYLMQDLPDKLSTASSEEGLASLQASHLSTSMKNYSSKLFLTSNSKVGSADGVNETSTCCSNVNSSSGEADNGGSTDTKSSSIIVFRRSNPKRAASLKCSPSTRKSNQLTRTTSSSRKCRKSVGTNTSFSCAMHKMSGIITRKRSCSRRPMRLSVWGAVENLTKIITPSSQLLGYDLDTIPTQNKRSKKGRSDCGRKKRPLSQNGRRLKVLATDFATSSSPPMFNAAASKRTSDEDGNNFKPSCDYRVDIGILRKVEVISRLAGDRCGVRVKLSQQHGDKDLESTLTQDTSADSMLGECPGVSSQIVPKTLVGTVDDMQLPLDPGTSPDSDVCHPTLDIGKMTSEGTTSRNQVVGNGQVVPVASNRRASASLTYSNAFVMSLPALVPESHTYHRKGSRNGEANEQPSSIPKHVSEKLGMARARQSSRYSKSKQKKQVVSNDTQIVCLKSIRKTTRKGSKWKSFPGESSVLGIAELDCCEESLKVQNGFETCVLPGQDVSNLQLEETVRTDKTEGSKLSRSTKPRPTKGRCSCSESSRRRRQNVRGKKKANIRISDCECRIEEQSQLLDSSLEATHVTSFSSELDNKLALIKPSEGNGKCSVGSRVDPEDVSSTVMTALGDELPPKVSSHGLEGQPLPPRVAWVLCDDCQKWRCISSALADILGATNCRWTCKDNSDKAFADCSIPQEKTNAEINAELEISDEEDVSTKKPIPMGNGPSKLSAFQRASWIPIKSNLFMHRNRRTQNIDEIMVCHCKRLLNGRLGCGDECLNRMLNIECVKGTCPCGDLCSNQQFQKRKYAKFKWFRCGKKGFGLQLQEDVSQGQFLIEYVGEVLDIAAYEARQRYYASRGQKHFYFMTLNGGEVIDACAKGNLGRFINHSCDPNCRTEKWMVNGEVCIGLFAMRDIKKGEEVTFDYNYERVFGAAAKKCVCGSSECRGYIGGDPLNSDVIIQGDSDEEDLEPVMVRGDSEKEWDVDWPLTDATTVTCQDVSVQREAILIKSSPIREPDVSTQIKDTMERSLSDANMIDIPPKHLDRVQSEENMCISEVQLFEDSKQISNSIQTGETICKPFCEIQAIETSAQNLITTKELLSESIANNNKVLSEPVDEKPITSKPHPLAKSSRSSNTIKKGRSGLKQLVPPKTKKLPASTGTGHSERVEEKLNELIDENGGISKRKDATKGYLKLLFVTAAGGDNDRGCAAQSARDLSLILDAILKTKSRMVLVDIINKNGLQMLHNIMKQNRSNFNRTPIIRKLLKVLEFLAQKGILTPEHIDKSPPFDKMESFKQSITALTWHSDTQVHQIARNFRDKWIPRTISRVEPSDRDSGKLDLQRSYGSWSKPSNFKCRHDQETRETDAIVCVSLEADPPASSSEGNISGEASLLNQQPSISAPSNDGSFVSGTRIRKRKSRWDESSDIGSPNPHSLWSSENHSVQGGPKFLKPTPLQPELASQSEVSMKQPEAQRERNSSYGEAVAAKSSMLQNSDEETPPGFGSPQKDNGPQISSQISMATGEVVMGQLQERYLSCLPVSYGIPAALMQQLGTSDAVGGNHSNLHWAIAPGMPFHPFPPLPPYPRPSSRAQTSCNDPMTAHGAREERATDHTIPSTSGEEAGDMDETGARNLKINGKGRWLANNPVRNSQRDQRAPPWPQRWNSQRNQRWSSWPRRGSGWPSWPRKGSGWPSWPRKGSEWPPWSQKGSDCGFRGSLRNRSPGLGLRGVRRDNRGGFNFPESVSNRDVTSNCHQQPNIS